MYQASATVVASFFNGKVVIVTGKKYSLFIVIIFFSIGSSVGIGRETARRFAENGAKVTLSGRNIQALQVQVQVEALFYQVFVPGNGEIMHTIGCEDW